MKSKEKKSDESCGLILEIAGQSYKSYGKTMFEAMKNLEQPAKIMSKGALTVDVNGNTRTILLMPAKIKRLFMKGCQEVYAKQIVAGL